MKNALLIVFVIAVCYAHAQTQENPKRLKGHIRYQGTHPTPSVGKGSSTNKTTTDGAATSVKPAHNIVIPNKIADGTVTTDKLASDILNSMRPGNKAVNANASVDEKLPALVPLYSAAVCNGPLYAGFMQRVMLQWQYVQTFSADFKSTGWLQYKVD